VTIHVLILCPEQNCFLCMSPGFGHIFLSWLWYYVEGEHASLVGKLSLIIGIVRWNEQIYCAGKMWRFILAKSIVTTGL
jgi:hypothetical protein